MKRSKLTQAVELALLALRAEGSENGARPKEHFFPGSARSRPGTGGSALDLCRNLDPATFLEVTVSGSWYLYHNFQWLQFYHDQQRATRGE